MKFSYEFDKTNIRQKRDEKFDLANVSCLELFEGLKFGLLDVITCFKFFEGTSEDGISLIQEGSKKYRGYCKDKNLYTKFNLCVKIENENLKKPASIRVTVDPFEIRMMVAHPGGLTTVQPQNLTNALIEFMNKKFPNTYS